MIKSHKINYVITFLFFLILILIFRFFGEDLIIKNESCNDPMLWLHSAGSQERLKYALNSKYCGVEIDVTFSNSRGLIASYNQPDNINAPIIEELISSNKKIKYWWLDLKNLNSSNAKKVSDILISLSARHNEKIFFVESHNFIGLWFLNTKPDDVYKVYWLAKGPNKNNHLHWSTPLYYLRSVLANIIIDPDFVSMFYYQASNLDFLWVGKRQRFAFTVNDSKEYKSISDMGVNVILTDSLKSFN